MSDLLANLSFNKGSSVRTAERENDRVQQKQKDGAVKKNDKNRAAGKIKKMAGKQQRD